MYLRVPEPMTADNFISEQNKFYLKSLDVRIDISLSKLEAYDSTCKLYLNRILNFALHMQMMGLIVLVSGITALSSFFISELLPIIPFVVGITIVFVIGIPLLLFQQFLLTRQQMEFEDSITASKNSMLHLKSVIYDIYTTYPQTPADTYDGLSRFQYALHQANFFLILGYSARLYNKKRFFIFKMNKVFLKNEILEINDDVKDQLEGFDQYWSEHYNVDLFATLDIAWRVIHRAMDRLGIKSQNPADTINS